MFLTVARGPSQSVFVRLDDQDDFARFEIRVAPDVAPGESAFALFECGAVVQQSGADFLISRQWLRRHALLATGDGDEWDRRFEDELAGSTDRADYVPEMDAVRAVVVVTPRPATS